MQVSRKEETARDLKEAFRIISPFIEKHTALVCPECEKVCCIDKHCHYDRDDLVFLEALGIEACKREKDREESEPCRFLSEIGCVLQRWERPFRCTFFFCDPLLKSLEEDNAKLYRTFIDYFQYMVSVRKKLLGVE